MEMSREARFTLTPSYETYNLYRPKQGIPGHKRNKRPHRGNYSHVDTIYGNGWGDAAAMGYRDACNDLCSFAICLAWLNIFSRPR